MSHGQFYRCIYYISGPGNISVVLLSTEGQRALRLHQKHLHLCSQDERRSYDMRVSNSLHKFHFGVNYPFN